MRAKRSLPGLLALGVTGVMALSGAFGAGSAMAEEPGEQCAGANPIEGGGSSLQKVAQEAWGKEFNISANGSACNGTQGNGGKPVVKYNPVGSGEGKLLWGAEKSGNKPLGGKNESPSESPFSFIGTDEPLNATQITNLDEAAGETEQALVIPVEQAAVAVIVNPPENCLITKITNENLVKIWNGEITLWNGVTGGSSEGAGVTLDLAGACESGITRVVRQDSSGTTFVFKLYLNEISSATCAGASETWSFFAEPSHNTEWPEETLGTCKGKVVHASKQGGGGVAEEVRTLIGSIGYANLADARAKYTDETLTPLDFYHWVGVQNERATKLYPLPGKTTSGEEPALETSESNCKKTVYTNVSSIKVGADDNWSNVSGAHPGKKATEQNENYPICTLTYDLALMNYTLAEFPNAENVSKTVYDYLNYVVAPGGGQTAVANKDYLKVEEAVKEFAREEALLIAEGIDLKFEASGSSITEFDETENLFLWKPAIGTTTLTVKDVASLPRTIPIVTLLVLAGKYSLGTETCSGKTLKTNETCTIEVKKEEAGLAELMILGHDVIHIE